MKWQKNNNSGKKKELLRSVMYYLPFTLPERVLKKIKRASYRSEIRNKTTVVGKYCSYLKQ